MSEYPDREAALEALLALSPDLEAALDALRGFDPPAAVARFVQLDRATIRLALDAFARGEISGALLERWAEALHGAEDVTLDPTDQEFLSEALFELSTPELFGSTEEIVTDLRQRDKRASSGDTL